MAEYTILKPPPKKHGLVWLALGVAVVVVAVGVGAFVAGRHTTTPTASSASAGGHTTTTTVPVVRTLSVVATTPAAGAVDVPSDQAVSVTLSAPLAGAVVQPVFSPPVAGSWEQAGPTTLTFAATAPFVPTTTETLTIPAGADGPRGKHGTMLAAPVTVGFTVAQASHRAAPAAVGATRLPAADLLGGRTPRPADPGPQRPGRQLRLALAQHADLAVVAVDRGFGERHHQGRPDELRATRTGSPWTAWPVGRCGRHCWPIRPPTR